MNKVEPIRDIDKIKELKNILLKQDYRDYLLFTIGINTGFRISDLLRLKVKDVKNRTHIEIEEKKTGKYKKQVINSMKKDIDKYISTMNEEEYLFKSQKGYNKPISRVQAYRVIKKAAKKIGIKKIGTHTLRKTFGYHHYKRNKDVAMLQKLFNHSSPSITLDYIGITQDEQDESLRNFYL